jgi:hypothetical protein
VPLVRSNTAAAAARSPLPQSRLLPQLGFKTCGWNETADTSSNSINEDEDEDTGEDDEVWGLQKGMELFEVSAKDDMGLYSRKSPVE